MAAGKVDVRVDFDYDAEEDDELTIHVGDIIKDVEREEGGWWQGTLNGKTGMFPDNFVTVIEKPQAKAARPTSVKRPGLMPGLSLDNPVEVPITPHSDSPRKEIGSKKVLKARVVYPFTPSTNDELELVPGDMVTVLEQDSDSWWTGELDGRHGMFPSNFVELVDDDSVKEGKPKKVIGVGFGDIFAGGAKPMLRATGRGPSVNSDQLPKGAAVKNTPQVPEQPQKLPPQLQQQQLKSQTPHTSQTPLKHVTVKDPKEEVAKTTNITKTVRAQSRQHSGNITLDKASDTSLPFVSVPPSRSGSLQWRDAQEQLYFDARSSEDDSPAMVQGSIKSARATPPPPLTFKKKRASGMLKSARRGHYATPESVRERSASGLELQGGRQDSGTQGGKYSKRNSPEDRGLLALHGKGSSHGASPSSHTRQNDWMAQAASSPAFAPSVYKVAGLSGTYTMSKARGNWAVGEVLHPLDRASYLSLPEEEDLVETEFGPDDGLNDIEENDIEEEMEVAPRQEWMPSCAAGQQPEATASPPHTSRLRKFFRKPSFFSRIRRWGNRANNSASDSAMSSKASPKARKTGAGKKLKALGRRIRRSLSYRNHNVSKAGESIEMEEVSLLNSADNTPSSTMEATRPAETHLDHTTDRRLLNVCNYNNQTSWSMVNMLVMGSPSEDSCGSETKEHRSTGADRSMASNESLGSADKRRDDSSLNNLLLQSPEGNQGDAGDDIPALSQTVSESYFEHLKSTGHIPPTLRHIVSKYGLNDHSVLDRSPGSRPWTPELPARCFGSSCPPAVRPDASAVSIPLLSRTELLSKLHAAVAQVKRSATEAVDYASDSESLKTANSALSCTADTDFNPRSPINLTETRTSVPQKGKATVNPTADVKKDVRHQQTRFRAGVQPAWPSNSSEQFHDIDEMPFLNNHMVANWRSPGGASRDRSNNNRNVFGSQGCLVPIKSPKGAKHFVDVEGCLSDADIASMTFLQTRPSPGQDYPDRSSPPAYDETIVALDELSFDKKFQSDALHSTLLVDARDVWVQDPLMRDPKDPWVQVITDPLQEPKEAWVCDAPGHKDLPGRDSIDELHSSGCTEYTSALEVQSDAFSSSDSSEDLTRLIRDASNHSYSFYSIASAHLSSSNESVSGSDLTAITAAISK